MKGNAVKYFIIGTFVSLYFIVSMISTIHVIDFFRLSNPNWLAVSLAIAFEIGAAASLASLIALKKMNKSLVWGLFIVLTAMQMMGNTYYAFTHLQDYQGWVDLFGLTEEEPIFQKRILSIISGAVLPVVALGFIKSLVDYIKPEDEDVVLEKPKLSDAEILAQAEKIQLKRVWDIAAKFSKPSTQEEDDEEPTALANSGIREREEREQMEREEAAKAKAEELYKQQLSLEFPEGGERMHSEEVKEAVVKAITDSNESAELTQKDIETYQEKSRIPPHQGANHGHPQVLPGVNM
jgi:hypothetical protein